MKIPIQKILQSDVLPIEASVDLSELEALNNDIRDIGSVSVKCEASIRDDFIYCQLNISGVMILPCARSLVDVRYPFEINTVEVFSEDPHLNEDQDIEIHPIEGEVLDLEPLIKENVLLEVPFRVYAKEDELERNTLSTGDGWTLISEDEKAEEIDPRFAKLQSLLNDEKNENQ
ncbi:YceD family protein [Amphibacillus sp. Q70]|uniref:YceD family protein n=1 Tax=Amphibacillus sp. Q70 TaxID=3453416 RepID=UPI003F8310D8